MPASLHRLAPALLGLCAIGAQAATAWDESSGDLSGNGLAPTMLSLGLGENLLLGRTGRTDGVVDRDHFAFTLPAGIYSFWVQDTGTGVADDRFAFAVSAVPEPAGWALWLAGAAALAAARRRREGA